MQKKKEKLLNKIVKRDYNNELESILEKKTFDENAKNLLLNILYKIESSYKDYEKVKRHVETKEEYITRFITMIKENCENIKICRMNSEANEILGDRTFLVEKDIKRIICYPIERKLLYCIAKISKNDKIIKDDYQIIDKTLSNAINFGNNIDTVEPLRDFNGYSWTTIRNEIESVNYNLLYQNLRMLLGYDFLEKWIDNKEFIIDYMEMFKIRFEEKYGAKNQKDFITTMKKLSMLLELKYNPKEREEYEKQKKEIEEKLDKIDNRQQFIQMITDQKRELTEEIKIIDETVNNKEMLQKEYIKRNEKLPLQKKIFSARILSKLMADERTEKIEEIERLNQLMNPKKFVQYKKELEEKYEYLKLLDVKDLEKEIDKMTIKLQKIFLKCYKTIISKIESKSEILDYIYEFRYYCLLPFSEEKNINEVEELDKELKETREILIKKAQELKVIISISKKEEIDDEILKNIFNIRAISLEEIYIKLIKEKDKYYIQFFDDDVFEEKLEIKEMGNINKKDLEIKFNKKIKIFT